MFASFQRLKTCLCKKGGTGTSTGIRPILLDIQGLPRDDQPLHQRQRRDRLDDFLWYLECVSALVKRKNAFVVYKPNPKNSNNASPLQDLHVDFNTTIVKGCTEDLDVELLKCQLLDWFSMVDRQHELMRGNASLPDQIRNAEMGVSLAGAPEASLNRVKEKLQGMQSDCTLRLEVLKELLEDVCLREMNLYVSVSGPPRQSLVLPPTDALGFLGIPLFKAGEPLPVG